MKNIVVRETDITEAFKVHKNVKEFDDPGCNSISYFENRYEGKDKIILVAYYEEIPIGYMIGYDRDDDNSFYAWMAGVDNNYRRYGALTALMNYFMTWSKNAGYNKIKIKTRNNKREMLSFLVKTGFNFVFVENKEDITENRIELEYLL